MIIPKVIEEHAKKQKDEQNILKKDTLTSDTNLTLTYNFTADEIKAVALFIRKYQNSIPKELLNFEEAIESKIYDTMSISEVMDFYQKIWEK